MYSVLKMLVIVLHCLLLFSCSSDSPDSPDGTEDPSGIWQGTYTTAHGQQFSSSALITSTGVVGIDLGNGVSFVGTVNDENRLKIVGSDSYNTSNLVTMVGRAWANWKLKAKVSIGSYSLNVDDGIDFNYRPDYDSESSFSKIAGAWSSFHYFGTVGQNWSIDIDNDGSFAGTASSFAVEGAFSLIDPSKNEYNVTMSINDPRANYTINGNYTGIAYVSEENQLRFFLVGDQQWKVIGTLRLNRN